MTDDDTPVRFWQYLTKTGKSPSVTLLTDAQALDRITHGIRIVPVVGPRELIAEIHAELEVA